MLTKSMAKQFSATSAHECLFVDFICKEEPKKVSEALKHPGWVFRNKKDETGIVIKNKARLVAQGYNQQEGIDYDETFSLVARLEAIRIFLAFTTYMNFSVYLMDVKSAFINGKLNEEVYVKQSLGFENNEFPNHVCKLDKAFYGLKQALRAWYETLSTFLTKHKFVRGKIDNTLFVYKTQTDVILVQIYVDDIIFGSTSTKLCKQFSKIMTQRYEMSMMGVLTYFLRFQIKQSERGISINQEKYVKDLLKKYETNPKESYLIAVKRIYRCLKGTPSLGMWYPKCLDFNLKGYSNSDYAGCNMDRKTTLGGVRGDIGITTFRNAIKAQYLAHSSMYVLPPSMTKVDYVKLIWENLIHKLNKKARENIVPYPRFISLLLEHIMPEYDNEDLTINSNQVFSVHNWTLKLNQHEEPPFTTPVKAICKLDVSVVSKASKPSSETEETEASKTKTGQSETETKFGLAKDKILSHPSPSTLVVSEMHKEAQQASGGLTHLWATSEEGAHLRLSSGSTPSVLIDKTKSAEDGLKLPTLIQVQLLKSQKDVLEQQKATTQDEDASLKARPSYPDVNQLTNLLVCHCGGNASATTTKDVPLAGQATASPAEREKNTKDAETNLKDELVDLLGTNVLKRLESIFTSVYAVVQKLKKDSWTHGSRAGPKRSGRLEGDGKSMSFSLIYYLTRGHCPFPSYHVMDVWNISLDNVTELICYARTEVEGCNSEAYLLVPSFPRHLRSGFHHMPETWGLCLSEEQIVASILKRPETGGHGLFPNPLLIIQIRRLGIMLRLKIMLRLETLFS
uniref:Retrovirus-related Pol polyprotein from transposon TNT 1-94 n=1 Tax=Tanacetum cinerariifolium TaxID=118510 RepID=A0A6L2N7M9_TANCI|nr:retrovirus-related Pol polyprotein from transposon TNT 1-94 [Tanacetum cinerariifolium]